LYKISRCPSCGGSDFEHFAALISRFIASYVLDCRSRGVDLLKCRACEMIFFNERYDDKEISKLYTGYRGDEYFRVRHGMEPWYTKPLNDELGGIKSMNRRKARIQAAIVRQIGDMPVGALLDYGGDHGQFIPDRLARVRIVYEFSGVRPVPGVKAISSLDQLNGEKVDAVLCCHVLEHCSNLDGILGEIKAVLKGVLYIEVPAERWRLVRWMPYKWGRLWLKQVSDSGKYGQLVIEFYSICLRKIFGFIPPFGCLFMHEHINGSSGNSV